jgi:hypothetical protein
MSLKDIKSRSRKTKEITLPVCGLVVNLKEPTVGEKLPLVSNKAVTSEEQAQLTADLIALCFGSWNEEGALVSKPSKDCTELELSVYDLGQDDFTALAEAVTSLLGVQADAETKSAA